MFKVHLGYTATGRNKWARFYTLDAAHAFCAEVTRRTGIVLAIVAE